MRRIHNVFEDSKPKGKCNEDNVFADFLLHNGLYDTIAITEENIDDLISLASGCVKVNIFCKECCEMRVFSSNPIYFYDVNEMKQAYSQHMLGEELALLQKHGFGRCITAEDGSSEQQWDWKNWQCYDAARLMVFSFTCAMDEAHRTDYVVITDEYTMRKIGQYPSVADLSFPELKDYRKVLSENDMREMRRAIGLFAQGIGVGSFVYLRRIYERIIDTAKNTAISEGTLTEDAYKNAHVDERTKLLKKYLPEMLTDNPTFYSIVSKGIHELSENECIEYFPVLQEAILMILHQWEQIRREKEAKARLSASMSRIASKIK